MPAIRELLSPRALLLTGLVVVCVLSRLIPHPPNFSPIEAVALFAGAWFASRALAILVPLSAMLLSDMIIGFHAGMPLVYACIAVMALAGGFLGRAAGPLRIAAFGLGSAVFFFLVTNFGVWVGSGMYPHTGGGLLACYVAAIPFFHNQLAGVAVYSALLFGGMAVLRRELPMLSAR